MKTVADISRPDPIILRRWFCLGHYFFRFSYVLVKVVNLAVILPSSSQNEGHERRGPQTQN